MKEQLDSNMLAAFIQGEQKGFSAVFDAWYNEIRYFTHKLISNREEAEDITIDTFSKLFKIHNHFSNEAGIRAFLYVTARNNSFNYLRDRRRIYTTEFSTVLEDILATDIPDELSQHAILETQLIKDIYAAIQQLPLRSRQILEMFYFEGKDAGVIAEQLSITRDTVRSQKRYALELLRTRFSDNPMLITFICTLVLLDNPVFLDRVQVFA
jgi:RNA polymerase sigma-70 factor (ECF subfamily)